METIASWSPRYQNILGEFSLIPEISDDLRLVGRNWCKGMFFL